MGFCPWYPLQDAVIATPQEAGVFQVRQKTGLINYPRGKSAMVHYGAGSNLRDEATAFAATVTGGDWLCRHEIVATPAQTLQTLVQQFRLRFGASPTVPAHSAQPAHAAQLAPPPLASLSDEELRLVSTQTTAHYDERAEQFWTGTRDHDVSENTAALLRHLPNDPPQRILDLGCGPGRDLIHFRSLGLIATGIDGAQRFVEMARSHSGCEVWHQDFLDLTLPRQHFHGVFANASLFHVPSQELPRVLNEVWHCLVPGGVLFASNPRGPNQEGWSGRRYGTHLELPVWRQFMHAAKFDELEHFYRPTGLPRNQQPWLASVFRRQD